MIGIGKTVQGSSKSIAYLLDDKGHAIEIARNLLFSDNPSELFWEMQHIKERNMYCKNGTLSAVLSPDAENVKNFTGADWRQLAEDFLKKMDLQHNQYIATLHTSTGTPHLHIIANRIDLNGKNRVEAHNIHVKMKTVADNLALDRGWQSAIEIKHERTKAQKSAIKAVLTDCMSESRNLDELAEQMQKKGFKMHYNIRDEKVIGLRITKIDETAFSQSDKTTKPSPNGFKLSEIDRKMKIADICRQLDKNLEESLKPRELTLEERIEARREHYRKEGMTEQGVENMINMELKYKMFERKSKNPNNSQEQEQKPKRNKGLRM